MKKGFFLRLFVLLMLTFFIAEQGRAQTYQRTSQGIKSTVQGINIDISFFSPVTVRILKSPDGWKYTKESLSVIGKSKTIRLFERGHIDYQKPSAYSPSQRRDRTNNFCLFRWKIAVARTK